MKNLTLIITAIIFLLSSCENNNPRPSRDTLQQCLAKYPKAEKIDVTTLKNWDSLFKIFRQNHNSPYLDIQSDWNKDLVKKPEYAGILCTYDAQAVNDSILFVTEFDPIIEKADKEGSSFTHAHQRKYIFHSNGDIEMKMGNMVSKKESDQDDGTFMSLYVDGKTGLIVNYWKNDFMEDNTYKITEDGKLEIGDDYGYLSLSKDAATRTLNLLDSDLKSIHSKLKENQNLADKNVIIINGKIITGNGVIDTAVKSENGNSNAVIIGKGNEVVIKNQ